MTCKAAKHKHHPTCDRCCTKSSGMARGRYLNSVRWPSRTAAEDAAGRATSCQRKDHGRAATDGCSAEGMGARPAGQLGMQAEAWDPPALRARQPARMSGSSADTCSLPCTVSTSARPCRGGGKHAQRRLTSHQQHPYSQHASNPTRRAEWHVTRQARCSSAAHGCARPPAGPTCAAPDRSTALASLRSFSSSQGTTPPSWSSPMSATEERRWHKPPQAQHR
jgi:hypothetical protein